MSLLAKLKGAGVTKFKTTSDGFEVRFSEGDDSETDVIGFNIEQGDEDGGFDDGYV